MLLGPVVLSRSWRQKYSRRPDGRNSWRVVRAQHKVPFESWLSLTFLLERSRTISQTVLCMKGGKSPIPSAEKGNSNGNIVAMPPSD